MRRYPVICCGKAMPRIATEGRVGHIRVELRRCLSCGRDHFRRLYPKGSYGGGGMWDGFRQVRMRLEARHCPNVTTHGQTRIDELWGGWDMSSDWDTVSD